MTKLKKFLNWRIYILFVALLLSLIAINPSFGSEGAAIKDIDPSSNAALVGLKNPEQDVGERSLEIIKAINDIEVKDVNGYNEIINSLEENGLVRIKTNKKTYDPFIKDNSSMGITVQNPASTNLRKGLELAGGTRVVLEPREKVSNEDLENIRQTLELRLNVFGISDINSRTASDLEGNKFIIVEIAGVSEKEVRDLVSKQGKFEAKIGNETVFSGGEKDITFVCRNDGTCSGIRSCIEGNSEYSCRFEFTIDLSPKAAKRHAEVTDKLSINQTSTGLEGTHLDKTLDLYLDGEFVDSLLISSTLKGQEASSILISGPGIGLTEKAALDDALTNMNELQTALITGSLPAKLDVVKIDSISPTLGSAFIKNAFQAGILAVFAVAVIIFIRYRKLKIAIPMMIITASEIIIILGVSAFTKFNLELAAIAGIIAAVGTGVDDQIVIADEISKRGTSAYNWKERVKRAFFIIIVAWATTTAAMLPLLWAGAGLLTGFALATITGVTIGILITRPAFAKIVEILSNE